MSVLLRNVKRNKVLFALGQVFKCFYSGIFTNSTLLDITCPNENILTIIGDDLKPKESIPKIIWMYWEDDIIPSYIRNIIEHNRRINTDHDVRVLNNESYKKYLPDVDFIDNMPIANKTDLIRLELLYRFGGIWMDATVILGDDLAWVHELKRKESVDIIGYYRDQSTVNYEFPVIESWLLCAAPQNELIFAWLAALKPLKYLGNEVFFKELSNRPDYLSIKQGISNPQYLLVYLAGQIAMREMFNFGVALKRCEDGAFYLQERCKWDNYAINFIITRKESPLNRMPIIKLTSGNRGLIDLFISLNLVKKNSLIGQFLAPNN